MCFELPARVLSVRPDGVAVVDAGGSRRLVSLAVLEAEDVRVATGDWLLVHTGLAVMRVDAEQATALSADLMAARRTPC